MSVNAKTLMSVLKKYISEDEDMVKCIKLEKGKSISFLFDMIDEERKIEIKLVGGSNYLVSNGKVGLKKYTSHNFSTFLNNLMYELQKEREVKIEYYSDLDDTNENEVGKSSYNEENEGELEEECETPDIDNDGNIVLSVEQGEESDTLGGMRDTEIQNMKLLREEPYEILTPQRLIETQQSSVQKISENLFVSKAGANIILRAYRWDVERVLNTFIKSGKDEVLGKVGLKKSRKVFKKAVKNKRKQQQQKQKGQLFECSSCLDDVPFFQTLKLDPCDNSHLFCKDCWKDHIKLKIKDGRSKLIKCMGNACNNVVDETIVLSLITNLKLRKKYETKLLESFVEDNDKIKWCQSSPHCGNACQIKVAHDTPLEIHCLCRSPAFCFSCLEEAHAPASCFMLESWKKKFSGTGDVDLLWIKGNARKCPHCKDKFEKNGGCNHMACKCGGHWCWICGGKTDSGGGHANCNKYNAKKSERKRKLSREDLDRYIHYYNHYNAHYTSFKNNYKKMEMEVNEKMNEMFKTRPNFAWTEVDWLRKALNVLFDTRRALMFSYVFAFYLFDRKKKKVVSNDNLIRSNVNRKKRKKKRESSFKSHVNRVRGRGIGKRRGKTTSFGRSSFTSTTRGRSRGRNNNKKIKKTTTRSPKKRIISTPIKNEEEEERKKKIEVRSGGRNELLLKGCKKFLIEEDRTRAQNLFEDTQEQLEKTTEALNRFLDMPLEKILTSYIKKEILSSVTLNEKRVHGLFDVIRQEMVIEGGGYVIPDPRYIFTSRRKFESSSNTYSEIGDGNFNPKPNFYYEQKKDEEDRVLQLAIQASLMKEEENNNNVEDDLLQEVLMRSLQEN